MWVMSGCVSTAAEVLVALIMETGVVCELALSNCNQLPTVQSCTMNTDTACFCETLECTCQHIWWLMQHVSVKCWIAPSSICGDWCSVFLWNVDAHLPEYMVIDATCFCEVFERTFQHMWWLMQRVPVQCWCAPARIYRFIHKSLRDFRTRLRNNQDRHGRKEHINR